MTNSLEPNPSTALPDTWSAQIYNKTASFVYSSSFTAHVLELLDANPGETIIDFGCGSGEVTLALQHIVGENGLVVGVDFSESMIEQAHKNGVQHCFVSDAQCLNFPPNPSYPSFFDAVFTNAALHWCKRDPDGVVRSAARVLKKGGRFVGEMGGYTNCIGVRLAIHQALRKRGIDPVPLDPWYFPSIEDYRARLSRASFNVTHISLHPRLTALTGTLVDWLRLFCRQSFFKNFDDAGAEAIMREVEDACAVDCRDESGTWTMMYTRLRFVAVLE